MSLRWIVLCVCAGGVLAIGAVASAASTPVSFSRAKAYHVAGLGSIALGDVNGDGSPDVATTDYAGGAVSVLLNKRDGTFAAARKYVTAFSPASVALGDLNGDGNADLVTANVWNDTVSVLFAAGDGTLQDRHDYETGFGPSDVAIGDLDGDGMLDLAVANDQADAVSVLRNAGGGSFEARQDHATGAGPDAVAIADVNRDGKLDLFTANGAAGSVSVLLNQGHGNFEQSSDYEIAAGFPSLAVGDLNGDSRPDLVVAEDGAPLTVFLSRADGTFGPRREYRVSPGSVAIGDVNGDGSSDVVADGFVGLSVLVNRGGGTLVRGLEYPELGSAALGDLNGDGRLDVAATDVYAGVVSIRVNAPGLCNVQQATDLSLAAAKRALARGHCRAGKIRRVYARWIKPGLVISQNPSFGAVLPQGGKVNLVISKGKRK